MTHQLYRRQGANIDCQTNDGFTPLHRAAFYGHERLARFLVLAGADQSIKDSDGQTAFDVAVTEGRTEIAQVLRPRFDDDGRNTTGIAQAKYRH